jgi:hypothetical protein
VVYLDAEFTVDQLTRWVKTTLITDDVSEEGLRTRVSLCQQGMDTLPTSWTPTSRAQTLYSPGWR